MRVMCNADSLAKKKHGESRASARLISEIHRVWLQEWRKILKPELLVDGVRRSDQPLNQQTPGRAPLWHAIEALTP